MKGNRLGSEGCHRNEEIRAFNQDRSAYLVSLESEKIVKREYFKRFAIKLGMRRGTNIWKNRRKDDEDFQSVYLLSLASSDFCVSREFLLELDAGIKPPVGRSLRGEDLWDPQEI